MLEFSDIIYRCPCSTHLLGSEIGRRLTVEFVLLHVNVFDRSFGDNVSELIRHYCVFEYVVWILIQYAQHSLSHLMYSIIRIDLDVIFRYNVIK